MEKRELEITISETGDVTVQVIGTKGKKCLDISKDIEEALGAVSNREMKASYYEQDDLNRITVGGTFNG